MNDPSGKAFLLLAAIVCLPNAVRACGGSFEEAPPTLPYYLDRLPAKSPSEIFRETFPGNAEFQKTDFKAALLALAIDCQTGQSPAALLAAAEKLLTRARLDPDQPAVLCNLLNDVRDLFAAAPPVGGQPAADYIRWRVEHAGWFHLAWNGKPSPYDPDGYAGYTNEAREKQRRADRETLERRSTDPSEGPLAVHWLYLRAAYDFPMANPNLFQKVIERFPDHPRAEAARFMLARCRLVASRSHVDSYQSPTPEQEAIASRERLEARALFEDYLKRYPKGRFAADVPGWLGALAYTDKDYLRALDCYLQQADIPDHPEVLKSAGFMCERCLSELDAGDKEALRRVAAHPRLAMSLIYLLINASDGPAENTTNPEVGQQQTPTRVNRWRRDLLPRLAAEVAAQKNAYADKDWQPRYLMILAQAASGVGEQDKALALCDMAKDEITRSDDLAFVRLVALERGHHLPEAIAAGRDFARLFPKSPLAPGAILRVALALQDEHQAGAAFGELSRLQTALTAQEEEAAKNGDDLASFVYPPAESLLTISRSVLRRDASGAEMAEISQLRDALLNFAPLPELAAALPANGGNTDNGLDGADLANLRAVLTQRWLAEEENFAEAKKYATPAQWSIAASGLEKLAADVAAAPAGATRASASLRLADGWAAARGRLVFAPLETDETRGSLFADGAARGGINRRENGLALGLPTAGVDHALSYRDEWRHAFDWWLKAADAAPPGSSIRARALWSALRAMPSIALASPYTFLRAGETDASGLSRKLCDRLRRECPDSREARQFAVYYDLTAPPDSSTEGNGTADRNLAASTVSESLPYGEPEYRWDMRDEYGDFAPNEDAEGGTSNEAVAAITQQALALRDPDMTQHPRRMAQQVDALRTRLHAIRLRRNDLCLVNFLDDLSDFLQEPADKLTPGAVTRYLELRMECIHVERWGDLAGSDDLPPVPGATAETINDVVLGHIREAYDAPEMAAFKDYLDFLAIAVVANENVPVPVPGDTQDTKDGDPDKKEPVTYLARDYPKLARLTGDFLKDHPHSRKREATRLLYARALYAASRPHVREKYAVWPESGHFASGTVIVTHRQQPFDPRKIGAALNAYDREFPGGRYAGEIRNLRGLLAWRTQDWPLALDLTLRTLADASDAVLQEDAGRRLTNLFVDGLTDETERAACLAAVKARPGASEKLRAFLPKSPFNLRVMQSWVLAQL